MREGAMGYWRDLGNIMAVQITHVRFNGYSKSEETIVRQPPSSR